MSTTTPRVVLDGVSFTHVGRDATPILADLDLVLTPGWTGLVGPNGAGKTTLLRLIAGALAPESGAIRREPAGLDVRWLVQVPDRPDAPIRALAERQDGAARQLLAELALTPEDVSRWATLSPGERRRWQLAAVIDAAPDVLLLDEPEGHLDVAARRRLVAALRRFRGIGVLVAHDRALLDAVTTTTVELDAGRARVFPGGYSDARAAWQSELAAHARRRAELHEAHARARASLDATRRRAEAADRQRSTGARMKSRHDSDARSVLGKNLAEWGARAHERGVKQRTRDVERLGDELAASSGERRFDPRAFAFVHVPPPGRVVAGGAWPELRAGPRVLARDLSLWLERDARVHLVGDNGAGKSTLVNALLDTLTVPRERVLVLPQELSPEATRAALEELRQAPPEVRGRALSLVAALGARPERLLASEAPSPGEARKLHLALGLARGVAALVLDEPTNHLDLPSIERLQAALAAWPGALLLVSHDAALAAAVTDRVWAPFSPAAPRAS